MWSSLQNHPSYSVHAKRDAAGTGAASRRKIGSMFHRQTFCFIFSSKIDEVSVLRYIHFAVAKLISPTILVVQWITCMHRHVWKRKRTNIYLKQLRTTAVPVNRDLKWARNKLWVLWEKYVANNNIWRRYCRVEPGWEWYTGYAVHSFIYRRYLATQT